MRKTLVIFMVLALIALSGTAAMATNGYQLIGIGQLQKSMGGAVTAAPRDSMTAITNPAGIARIGSRADFSMEAFMPTRSVDFTGMGGMKTEGGTDMYGIPAIGWTAPTSREGVYFGGGMYGTSGLGVDFGQVTMMPGAGVGMIPGGTGGIYNDITFNGHSSIMFWKMAPTVAVDIDDKTTLGFALNIDYQSVAITQRFRNIPLSAMGRGMYGTQEVDVNFDLGRPTSQFGMGFTLGALYDVNDMVTIGAMYSSKQSFSEAEFQLGQDDVLTYGGATGMPGVYTMELDYPPQYAIGVAVKPVDKLLVAIDFKQINWSETHDKVKFSGPLGSFMTMAGPTSSIELNFGWEDQTIYALGLVYAATEDLDLSAGYNYGEAPIGPEDVFNNLVLPATVEAHYTLGADYRLGTNWGLGFTYMKAKSEKITGTNDVPMGFQGTTGIALFPASSGIAIELEEESIGTQLSYRF